MSTKKISVFLISFSILVAFISIILTMTFNTKAIETKVIAETTSSTAEVQYILKDNKGYLGVFYSDSDTPYLEFKIKTNSFDEYDQKLLIRGIEARSEEELRQLIEDYTG